MAKRGPRDVQKSSFRTPLRKSRSQQSKDDLEISVEPGMTSQQRNNRQDQSAQNNSHADHDNGSHEF